VSISSNFLFTNGFCKYVWIIIRVISAAGKAYVLKIDYDLAKTVNCWNLRCKDACLRVFGAIRDLGLPFQRAAILRGHQNTCFR